MPLMASCVVKPVKYFSRMLVIVPLFLCTTVAAYEITESVFIERDINGDGQITTSELPIKRLFRMLDQDGNGSLTRVELGLPEAGAATEPEASEATAAGAQDASSEPASQSESVKPAAPQAPATPVHNSVSAADNKGYKSVLMGHSFFRPMAAKLEGHAHRTGFTNHSTTLIFKGGAGGAPISLWDNPATRAKGQAALDAGGIEMLGLTAFPHIMGMTEPVIEAIDGYKNWIDYAHQANPGLKRVFIAVPWDLLFQNVRSQEERKAKIQHGIDIMHAHIDTLRGLYPTIVFQCIPYGMGAIKLEEALAAGKLSGVQHVLAPEKSGRSQSIYGDGKGHASPILNELSDLIWLNAIYGVDLKNDYPDFVSAYDADLLKEIALEVMAEHDDQYEVQFE